MVTGQVIEAVLSADSTVGPLVADPSPATTHRIFPLQIPIACDQMPVIVYEGDDAIRGRSMAGLTGKDMQTVRIGCQTGDYDSMIALSEAVVAAMDNQRGSLGGVQVDRIIYRGETEDDEPLPGTGEGVITYVKVIEFLIAYYSTPNPGQ